MTSKAIGRRENPRAARSGGREGEQARERAAADIVDARIDDALALDLHQDRRIEGRAIELAQHQREVGALRVPGGLEIGTELDLRRAVRSAHRELPAPVARLALMPLRERRGEPLRCLLERESP